LALDDFEDRFATAVKLALDASRASGDDKSDAADGAQCPPVDAIASYYESAVNRTERARLETHFSGCARCQDTLAALLRAAPAIDTASAAAGFRAAAARGTASESTGIRERWFEISPAWRIAGTTAAATAILAVAVVGSMDVYRNRMGRESAPVIASSAAPRLHRDEAHPRSSNNELALNELKSSAPTAPKAATAPSAGVVSAPIRDAARASSGTSAATSSAVPSAAAPPASTGEATTGSSTPAEPALPSEEAAPPNTEQTDAAAAAGAQAAAALGALALTPAPAATAAPSIATAVPAASAAAAATPSVTSPPAAAGASANESRNASAAIAAAPAAMAGMPGTAASPPRMQQFHSATMLPAPAIAPERNYREKNHRQSGSLTVPAAAGGASALSASQRTQERFAKEQLAEEHLAEEKRNAELARKAELARRDADLKRQRDLAQRELAAPIPMQTAAAPRVAAPSGVGSNEIAMAERPVASAPAVATMVRGIPVAPHALLISPADHSIYWSLQNSGVIYRSNDRKSWTPVFTAMPAELLAGMAPSDTVCWAVGRKGVILLTTDGIHWARVNSPTASDVIGISAASKDVATIFTAAGVTYSTFDGGSNWTPAN
jgi:hypothetical protein